MRNWSLLATAVAVTALTAAAPADPVHDTSFKEANGDRVLQLYVDVKASPQCLWHSFADEDGLKAFGLKLAHVDMRNGGTIEEGFSETAKLGGNETIRHHIIAYLPERLLVLRNEATPPGPPHAELYRNIVQVITVEPHGKEARLTLSHTGYGTGAEYDQLYAFFHNVNHGFLTGVKSFCETRT
jgi:Activator of Hsp90 ATPase homolog 1-like protein